MYLIIALTMISYYTHTHVINRCDGLFSSLPELSASPSSSSTTSNKRLRLMVESRETTDSGGYWHLDRYFSGLGALGQVGSDVLDNPPDAGDHQYKVSREKV